MWRLGTADAYVLLRALRSGYPRYAEDRAFCAAKTLQKSIVQLSPVGDSTTFGDTTIITSKYTPGINIMIARSMDQDVHAEVRVMGPPHEVNADCHPSRGSDSC